MRKAEQEPETHALQAVLAEKAARYRGDPAKQFRCLLPCAACERMIAEICRFADEVGFPAAEGSLQLLHEHPTWQKLEARLAERTSDAERAAAARAVARTTDRLHQEFADGASYAAAGFNQFRPHGTEEERRLQAAAVDACRAEARRIPPRNVILMGPPGTGKDLLAKLMLRSLASRLRSLSYMRGLEFFASVRDLIRGEGGSEAELLSRHAGPEVLCISDPLPPFGELTEFQGQMFYRLLERRIGKATWVTLNVADSDEAERRMGVQSFDRLCDGALVVCCRWPSWRQPAQIVNPPKLKPLEPLR